MTREQVINKVIAAVPLNDISIAKDAVDEYTKQESIAFKKWCNSESGMAAWETCDNDSQLYNLYLQSKNKDNANNNSQLPKDI